MKGGVFFVKRNVALKGRLLKQGMYVGGDNEDSINYKGQVINVYL